MEGSMPAHTERSCTIDIDDVVGEVFPLFTPKGEEAWVEGWCPDYLHPASGETCEGMVFRTGHSSEATLWTCVLWRPDEHYVRYVRVTPASGVAVIDVSCRARSDARTAVTVSYAYTATTADGAANLAELGTERFAAMIDGWRAAISSFLRSEARGNRLRTGS
jgi:hypothetical protein